MVCLQLVSFARQFSRAPLALTSYNIFKCRCASTGYLIPCYLVLSTLEALVTVFTSRFHCFLSAVTSHSSASFIPVTSCISSIHFLLGCPLLLLPSPYASIILFSSPSDRITCPKNPSFLLSAVCCSVSSSSIPISMRTLSLVFFSVHDILCIFLHIRISHALIFFSIFFVIVHVCVVETLNTCVCVCSKRHQQP